MKLLKKPTMETGQFELQTSVSKVSVSGRTNVTNVEIVVPDKINSKDDVWHKLKYGAMPDFELGRRIKRIDFPEDGLILYGVLPVEIKRTDIWEGRVVECNVDRFEEI